MLVKFDNGIYMLYEKNFISSLPIWQIYNSKYEKAYDHNNKS